MRISFVITGVINLDDSWGDPTQLQREIKKEFLEAVVERSRQWSGAPTPTQINGYCTTLIQSDV